jgi:hypothetical protein
MLEAEHWRRVVEEQWSGPPTSVVSEGFRKRFFPKLSDLKTRFLRMVKYRRFWNNEIE